MKRTDVMFIFKNELDLIENEIIKEFTLETLCKLPNYFFEIGASTSGKYHPSYALGYGGLVRHTKAAVKIADDLLGLEQNEHLSKYKDVIISALILHDGMKCGEYDKVSVQDARTDPDHPAICANFVEQWWTDTIDAYITQVPFAGVDWDSYQCIIADLIRSHMGQWDNDGSLPKPKTDAQKFVHLCDYLASRKYLTCDVN